MKEEHQVLILVHATLRSWNSFGSEPVYESFVFKSNSLKDLKGTSVVAVLEGKFCVEEDCDFCYKVKRQILTRSNYLENGPLFPCECKSLREEVARVVTLEEMQSRKSRITLEELKVHIKQLDKEVEEKGWEAVYNTPESRKRLEESAKHLREHKKLIAESKNIDWELLNKPMTV